MGIGHSLVIVSLVIGHSYMGIGHSHGQVTHASQTLSFGVVILAAGASSRMGQPKLLLPWGNTSILGHLIAQWRRIGAEQIAVVTSASAEGIDQELRQLGFPEEDCIRNPAPELGMFTSIQCAARWSDWKSNLTHCVIALGDQPHLRRETLSALLSLGAAHREAVCQLTRQGRRRHPVLLPQDAFRQLAHSRHHNLKEFLQSLSSEVALQESEDAGLDLDLDQPADYEKAVQLYGARVVR